MNIQDVIFDNSIPSNVREAFFRIVVEENITDPYTAVIMPSETNDDVNGSQHVSNGGTDFTYVDASASDIAEASTMGYYEYFSREGSHYTGHYYNGEPTKFAAVVVDPPAYAASIHI